MTENSSHSLNLLRYVWIPIVLALIAAAAAIIPPLLNKVDNISTPPPDTAFAYQVRVEVKDTTEPISNAEVTLEVGGKAPLRDITDSNGFARIFVDTAYTGQPGKLIVKATGYSSHTEHIDLRKDVLPTVVRLEPVP